MVLSMKPLATGQIQDTNGVLAILMAMYSHRDIMTPMVLHLRTDVLHSVC